MGTDLNTNKLAWESIPAFTGTAEAKVLRDDGTDKAKTMLVRLQAGGCVIPHSHVATVQYDIYDGEYESEGRTYAAGTYGVLLAHTDVAEITTQNGVVMLMI